MYLYGMKTLKLTPMVMIVMGILGGCAPKQSQVPELVRVIQVQGRQGVACDGRYYYVSGSTALYKYKLDGTLLLENTDPFADITAGDPRPNHIGDIDVLDGEIYAGCEYFMDGVGKNIQTAVYDAATLEYKRSLPWEPESGQKECCGLAVDRGRGLVWMADWVDGTCLYCYRKDSGEYVGKVALNPAPALQQGIFCLDDGKILISSDDGDADADKPDHLYACNPFKGRSLAKEAATEMFMEMSSFTKAGEIEGLTINPLTGELVVLSNRGARIVLGMPRGFYPGYDSEIHELYVFRTVFPDVFPAEWIVPKGEFPSKATNGSAAYAALEDQGADSAWVFHFPARKIPRGTFVEFDWSMSARKGDWEHYRAEYSDGGEWVPIKEFDVLYGQSHPATELSTVRLGNTIRNELKIRLLPVHPDSVSNVSSAILTRKAYTGAKALLLGNKAPQDSMKVLFLGNSNTYYNCVPALMKEIAWKEGRFLDIEMSTKGGQTFAQHLTLTRTMALVRKGGYDAAILQNNTKPMVQVALFPEEGAPLVQDCVDLCDSIRAYSPGARIILERGFPYSGKDFWGAGGWEGMNEALDKTAEIMSQAAGTEVSPIGQASEKARTLRDDLVLYQSDHAHPTLTMSYIKACVNYLTLCCPDNPSFGPSPPDCGLDPELAAWLRGLSVEAVRNNNL